jgi:hypothetical protein
MNTPVPVTRNDFLRFVAALCRALGSYHQAGDR